MSNKRIDLTGMKFGRLCVKEFHGTQIGNVYWKCDCDCGNITVVSSGNLRSGRQQSCGCLGSETHRQKKGAGNIGLTYWNRIKKGAASRSLEFNLDPDYLWDLFQKQQGRCAYSGIPLVLVFWKSKNSPGNASLDRIDSSLGYVYGNVQWVDKRINAMKSNLPHEEFITLCKAVANNNDDYTPTR